MKKCSKCGEEKRLSQFYKDKHTKDGHRNECKSCMKEYSKDYRKNNSQTIKEYKKKHYQENSEKVKRRVTEYQKNRRKTDPLFRLKCNVRNMLNRAIKTKRTEEIIGCSYKHLKQHLENQFTEGMSWDNYGLFGWHVDHIRPLSWFDLTNEDEVAKANHYSNLQPLWAEDNLSKSNKFA